MQGTGLWVLTGSNTYGGDTAISAGTLQLGDGVSHNGSVAGNIVNNSALVFANPFSQTYGGVVSGNGSFSKAAAGTLLVATTQAYAGPTYVNNGVLRLGAFGLAFVPDVPAFGANTSGTGVNSTINNGTWSSHHQRWRLYDDPGDCRHAHAHRQCPGGEARSAFYRKPVPARRVQREFCLRREAGHELADGVTFIFSDSQRPQRPGKPWRQHLGTPAHNAPHRASPPASESD